MILQFSLTSELVHLIPPCTAAFSALIVAPSADRPTFPCLLSRYYGLVCAAVPSTTQPPSYKGSVSPRSCQIPKELSRNYIAVSLDPVPHVILSDAERHLEMFCSIPIATLTPTAREIYFPLLVLVR